MPRFQRTYPPPPARGSYQAYRPFVRRDFEERCAYCLMSELLAGGQENFELDHFRPRSKFPELTRDYYNLYYACHICNQIKSNEWPSEDVLKSGRYFVDLCQDDVEEHYQVEVDGSWSGLTLAAQYTIDVLRLNRSHLVEIRKLLRLLDAPPAQAE